MNYRQLGDIRPEVLEYSSTGITATTVSIAVTSERKKELNCIK